MLGQQQQQQQQHFYYSPGSSVAGSGMLAAAATDESQLVSYVEDYLDCVESLPLEIQRSVSLLREIDAKYGEALKEIDEVFEKYTDESDPNQKKRLLQQLQRALIVTQELGDDKIQLVTQVFEMAENRTKQIDSLCQGFFDVEENEKSTEKLKAETNSVERSSRRPRRQRNSESRDLCHLVNGMDDGDEQPHKEKKTKSKKRKRSKAKQEREVSPIPFAIDPNEPTYCLCNQVSYGEMIGCDNDECAIEWFHFSCVGLTYKPKGKWYCPDCRGDSEKTMNKNMEKTKRDRRSR
ncbi:inhibitor of growth protein 2 [Spea bombifrons]|uniref:inhibitor of growth protein 2 n=1 Tax=Spea bombifrons TaxID=233779 RepID=UPI00234A8011|nr:inhibitor of growth protein 2 [Spea bombifrons]